MPRPPTARLLTLVVAGLCLACGSSPTAPADSGDLRPARRAPTRAPAPTQPATAQVQPGAPAHGDATSLPTIGDDARHESVVLRIEGMTCAYACPKEVRYQLEAVPGVVGCSVDFTSKTASCRVMPGTDPATLPDALRDPYSGTVVRYSP